MRGVRIVVGLIIMFGLVSTSAWAQNFAATSAVPLSVSWSPRTSGAKPSIEGYVNNDSHYWVRSVRLRIEGLDAQQRPIGERYVWTSGQIPPRNRIYYVTESLPGAASYRISVASYEVMSMSTL